MGEELDVGGVAAALLAGVSVLVRRVRQVPVGGGLTMPERTALSCLERTGPTTSAALAREVQVTAQAMGETLGALGSRGLIERRRDPEDRRRAVLTVTEAGVQALKDRRNARAELIAKALASGAFTPGELEQLTAAAPLLERLAQSI
ncbi:MarR family winged helix-turn-helix transcriptional regulator [Kutzneria sp. CA-103260]|uniref:MarR family winged helix-turn-helix transcriptional regulator n=1 Tax=Kutzneria sp. CA-103260 TaxID=2802641 RepID=UPI001BA52987|nr:MarR family winged helix-turn-helix transcriptional regulator [Kutzneria sp. CA-103260]QUQ62329.1 MarR family transcriptional regulator [Kutzneria sp. CA-103260]